MNQATLVLAHLQTDPRFSAHITAWCRLAARPATYAEEWPPIDLRL